MARQNELDSDDVAALDALSQKMDKHLNRITPRKKSASSKRTNK
jgi:ribosome-associated translation inhibitor RaiA